MVEKNNDLNIPYDIYEDMIAGIKKSGNVIRPNELYNAIRDAAEHNGSSVLAKFYDLEVELISEHKFIVHLISDPEPEPGTEIEPKLELEPELELELEKNEDPDDDNEVDVDGDGFDKDTDALFLGNTGVFTYVGAPT